MWTTLEDLSLARAMEEKRKVEDCNINSVEEISKVELNWLRRTKGEPQIKRR
jgi:hypothetical protein